MPFQSDGFVPVKDISQLSMEYLTSNPVEGEKEYTNGRVNSWTDVNKNYYRPVCLGGKFWINWWVTSQKVQTTYHKYKDGTSPKHWHHLYVMDKDCDGNYCYPKAAAEISHILDQIKKYKLYGYASMDYDTGFPMFKGNFVFNIKYSETPGYLASLGYKVRRLPAWNNRSGNDLTEYLPWYPEGACSPGNITIVVDSYEKGNGSYDYIGMITSS